MQKVKKIFMIGLAVALAAGLFTAAACAAHEHTWDAASGECVDCGEKCVHEFDADTGKCIICGYECKHEFVNGVCENCGKTTIFRWQLFTKEDALGAECDEKGIVVKVVYDTFAYAFADESTPAEDMPIEKTMYVYTPYGYSSDQQYDVLYLIHGAGENEAYWFAQDGYDPAQGFGGIPNITANVLDNMIKQEMCKPLIVVSLTTNYTWGEQTIGDVDALSQELQNDVMPYIAENFYTYASSGSSEDLIAARDHQGMAGFSMGSMTTWRSGIRDSLHYLSWFGSYSGGAGSNADESVYNDIAAAINEDPEKYPINFWLHANGTLDTAHDSHVQGYGLILEKCPNALTAGDGTTGNCTFIDIKKGMHSYPSWITALYNSLLVFFK